MCCVRVGKFQWLMALYVIGKIEIRGFRCVDYFDLTDRLAWFGAIFFERIRGKDIPDQVSRP